MKPLALTPVALAAALLIAAGTTPDARAQDDHADHSHHAAAKPVSSVSLKFPEAPLVASDGRKVRFASEVLGDRLVVIDFVYTSCTTVCPVVSAILSQVQERLGPRLGDEVRLVSLTVDPARDTPAQLKAYSAKHGAKADWLWLSGQSEAVNSVLKVAGTWTPNFEDHPAVILVGDARTGQWTRFYGFASPDEIMSRLDGLALARKSVAGTQHHHH